MSVCSRAMYNTSVLITWPDSFSDEKKEEFIGLMNGIKIKRSNSNVLLTFIKVIHPHTSIDPADQLFPSMVDGHTVDWHTNLHQSNHSYTLLKYILQANINLLYILELFCPFDKKYFTNDFITVAGTSFKRWQDWGKMKHILLIKLRKKELYKSI